jgi:hypothetical protein
MDFDITSVIQTRSQLELLAKETDILIDSLYRSGDQDFDHKLRSAVRISTAAMIGEMQGSQSDMKRLLEDFKESLSNAEYFQITLAFEPTQKFVGQIVSWVRENINSKAILDINYDSNLIGGAQLSYKGKYVDLSLRKKLSETNLQF